MLMLEVDSDSDETVIDRSSSSSRGSSDLESVPLATLKKNATLIRSGSPEESFDSDTDDATPKKKRKVAVETKMQLSTKTPFLSTTKKQTVVGETIRNGVQGKEQFTCDTCLRNFTSRRSLVKHIETGRHVFRCKQCPAYFLKSSTLEKHVASKHVEKPCNKCPLCFQVFSNEEELNEHCVNVHEIDSNVEYRCGECPKVYKTKEGLEYHEKKVHDDGDFSRGNVKNIEVREFTCKTCSKTFGSKVLLSAHLKVHHVRKNLKYLTGRYQCIICPRSFTSSDGLKYHLATHTGERKYGCGQCTKRFIKKTHLLEHISTHGGAKSYKCERCPRTFTTLATFKKHLKMFPGNHSFTCDKCGKLYTKESKLEKHCCVALEAVTLDPEVTAQLSEDMIEQYLCMTEEANKEAGLKSCYKCFKVFPSLVALQQHQEEHVGKQTYQCRFCPKTFLRANEFSFHIKNHLGSTPYMCLQCKRKFISPFTLATHAKKFPGEHSFTCTKCKRWFPCPEYLLRHDCILQNCDSFVCACGKEIKEWADLVGHAGGKPHKCCACDQKFTAIVQFALHIKRHTGFRPFACNKCDRTFQKKMNWSKHLQAHERKVLKCDLCDYEIQSRKRFSAHMAKKHDVCGVLDSDGTLCPTCGVMLGSLTQLKSHVEQEHGGSVMLPESEEKKKKVLPTELCTLCGKMLNNKYGLASHLKKVHGPKVAKEAKTPQCGTCGETFKTKARLQRHQDVHDVPGPRPCSICSVKVNSAKELRTHQRQHDELRPFSCPRCGKHFKVAASLKYHATICGVEKKRPRATPEDEAPVYKLIAANGTGWCPELY